LRGIGQNREDRRDRKDWQGPQEQGVEVASTKDRIIDSSAELFRRQGYNGTGLKQIVSSADAPFGSLYHFFPGGKEQLGEHVIRSSGALYLQLFASIAVEAPDMLSAVGAFFSGAADTLHDTDFADACPIATVALEVASTNEQLRQATADVFDSWIDAATEYLVTARIEREQARALAFSMLCLLEGAFVFSRSLRSTEPLEAAGASALALIAAAMPGEAAMPGAEV
jgi:AcrR family transcriptional regulator